MQEKANGKVDRHPGKIEQRCWSASTKEGSDLVQLLHWF
jgi:hypothetical protein